MSKTSRILIYRDKGLTAGWPDLSALWALEGRGANGVSTTFTSSADELETELRQKHAEILVLALNDELSPALEATLQKCRNFSQARSLSIVALARSLEPAVIERLIRLRVFWLYLEPVRTDIWMASLERLLKVTDAHPASSELSPTKPVELEVHAFSRIGKVHLSPPGALEVETSLRVRPGDVMPLAGTFPDLLKGVNPQFRVKTVHHDNIYYRFESRLELESLFELSPDAWKGLLDKDKSHWAPPKTKLLWITSDYSTHREQLFDKTLFSVYTESPQSLNLAALNRIAPRIVLVNSATGDTRGLIETWNTKAPHPPGLIITSFPDAPPGWHRMPCFVDNALSDELTAALRDFLLKRIPTSAGEARFVSRNSIYSRVHTPLRAKLVAISHRYFSFTCPHDFQIPAAVQLRFPGAELTSPLPLFGRTLFSEYLETPNHYHVTCEWLPHCDELARLLPDYKKILRTGSP